MGGDKVIWKAMGVLLLGVLVTLTVELIDRQRLVSLQRGEAVRELNRLGLALEGEARQLAALGDSLARQLESSADLDESRLMPLSEGAREQEPLLLNVAVSSGLRVIHVSPRSSNEVILGLNFALRPEMLEGIQRAIERRGSALSAPLPLLQNGQPGLVVRTPFFAAGVDGAPGELRGLVSLVVDIRALLRRAGVLAPGLPFEVAIRGRESSGAQGDMIYGEASLFRAAELRRSVRLPDGSWVLAARIIRHAYPEARQWWLRGIGGGLTLLWLLLLLDHARRHPQPHEAQRVPLRWFLSLRLTLLLLPLVAVQGWLSYQAGLASGEQLQKQLAGEVGARVRDKVAAFFDVPRQLLRFNLEQVAAGQFDLREPEALLGNFLLQMRQQPLLTFLSVGTAEGEYFAASRPPQGEDRGLRILTARLEDGREMRLYRVDAQNRRGSLISRGNDFFDARTRPWFKAAREQGSMAWYPAYRYAINDQQGAYDAVGVGMSVPVHDAGGEFLGVLTADVAMVQLSRELAEITRDTGGVVSIVNPQGQLVATSSVEPLYELRGNQTVRIRSTLSDNPQVRAVGEVVEEFGTPEGRAFREVDGERYLVDWSSYPLANGPTLTIGVALPHSQFIAPTSSLLRNLALVALAVLAFSLLAASVLSSRLAWPLTRLSRWAVGLGSGAWNSERPPLVPVRELHALSSALEQMGHRLAGSNEALRCQVAERTAELERANRELQQLSNTDGLTRLANRRMFDHTLEVEWARARRSGQPLALLMLDIDLFKSYNDCYGHLAGDDCLRQVATLIHAHSRRAGDLPARYGGEEFAVIAADIDEAGALVLAEGICRDLEAQAIPHQRAPRGVVTISIGVAVRTPRNGDDAATLIKAADQALYQAKSGGRNRVELAVPVVG